MSLNQKQAGCHSSCCIDAKLGTKRSWKTFQNFCLFCFWNYKLCLALPLLLRGVQTNLSKPQFDNYWFPEFQKLILRQCMTLFSAITIVDQTFVLRFHTVPPTFTIRLTLPSWYLNHASCWFFPSVIFLPSRDNLGISNRISEKTGIKWSLMVYF